MSQLIFWLENRTTENIQIPWIILILSCRQYQNELWLIKLLMAAIRTLYVVGVHEEAIIRFQKRKELINSRKSGNKTCVSVDKPVVNTDYHVIPPFQSQMFSPSLSLLQNFFHVLLALLPCQQENIRNLFCIFQLFLYFSTYGTIASLLLFSVDFPRRMGGIIYFNSSVVI
jgi:hypothetical protein